MFAAPTTCRLRSSQSHFYRNDGWSVLRAFDAIRHRHTRRRTAQGIRGEVAGKFGRDSWRLNAYRAGSAVGSRVHWFRRKTSSVSSVHESKDVVAHRPAHSIHASQAADDFHTVAHELLVKIPIRNPSRRFNGSF